MAQSTIQSSCKFDDDFLPDLDVQLSQTLTEVELVLVQDIITELQNNNEEKWCHLTPEICYTELLKNGINMMNSCMIKDIQCIGRVMELHTGRQWYNSKFSKLVNVNNIVEAFDGYSFVQHQHKSNKSATHQIKSLLVLCKNVIKNLNYPLVSLQSAYTHGVHQM